MDYERTFPGLVRVPLIPASLGGARTLRLQLAECTGMVRTRGMCLILMQWYFLDSACQVESLHFNAGAITRTVLLGQHDHARLAGSDGKEKFRVQSV